MIEQTDLIITKWNYDAALQHADDTTNKYLGTISLQVMKKRTAEKKGIACRFSCVYTLDEKIILECAGEDSYVIDVRDVIDHNELHTMLQNSYSKFKEKFDFRKMITILWNQHLPTFNEKLYDVEPVLQLLN